jgi:hypothetical protein
MNVVRFGFLFVVISFNVVGLCYGYDGESKKNESLAIALVDFSREGPEVSEFVKITADSFKKAAVLGLINHSWKITKIADDEVTGVLKENYTAKIVRAHDSRRKEFVKIYISGPTIRQSWADIIRNEMIYAFVLLTNPPDSKFEKSELNN